MRKDEEFYRQKVQNILRTRNRILQDAFYEVDRKKNNVFKYFSFFSLGLICFTLTVIMLVTISGKNFKKHSSPPLNR